MAADDPREDPPSDDDLSEIFPLSEEERAKADDLREDLDDDEMVIWTVEDGEPVPEVVELDESASSWPDPVDIGEETNAAEDHDEIAWGP